MRIGIIGCGQLAQMMALAGQKHACEFVFLGEENEGTSCVDGLGDIVHMSLDGDAALYYEQMGRPDVITVEKEQVDLDLLKALQAFCEVHPNPEAVSVAQNRIREKTYLDQSGLPVAPFAVVENNEALIAALDEIKPPVFVKHPSLGYDGKHQWRIKDKQTFVAAPDFEINDPCVVEQKIDFLFEASLIGVRSKAGEIRFYTPAKNYHEQGVLLSSLVCKEGKVNKLVEPAKQYLTKLLEAWNYVGVLTMELFVTNDGLIINELAPRVHNSGHWTMNANLCSQFENHIRAIAGIELGETTLKGCAAMINLLGVEKPSEGEALDNARIHWYKKSVKPRRKVGHVNIANDNINGLIQAHNALIQLIYPELDFSYPTE